MTHLQAAVIVKTNSIKFKVLCDELAALFKMVVPFEIVRVQEIAELFCYPFMKHKIIRHGFARFVQLPLELFALFCGLPSATPVFLTVIIIVVIIVVIIIVPVTPGIAGRTALRFQTVFNVIFIIDELIIFFATVL